MSKRSPYVSCPKFSTIKVNNWEKDYDLAKKFAKKQNWNIFRTWYFLGYVWIQSKRLDIYLEKINDR